MCLCALTILLVDFAYAAGVQNAIVGGSRNSAAITPRYSRRAGLRRGDVRPNLLRVGSTQTLRGLNNSFRSTSVSNPQLLEHSYKQVQQAGKYQISSKATCKVNIQVLF